MERIYISVDSASTKETHKTYSYILEHSQGGRVARVEGSGMIYGTYHAATISAITMALSRFTRPCYIYIISADDLVLSMMTNGYMTTKGKEVANKDLWEQLWRLCMKHTITTRKE